MLNQAAIADILQLATFAGLSAPGVVEALRLGSANSRALELLNTMITADTVDHLASVEAFDAELFDRAMRDAGESAQVSVWASVLEDVADEPLGAVYAALWWRDLIFDASHRLSLKTIAKAA